MNDAVTRNLETFIRVREVLNARADKFPAGSRALEVAALLDTAISDIERHAAAQSSGRRAAKEKGELKSVAFDAMRKDMEALSRTARAMSLTMPGLADKFRLPHNAGEQTWLAAARSFATDAVPLKDEFIHRGMPADFLDDFNADITEFEQAIQHKAQTSGEAIAARASLNEAVGRAINAVREMDAIFRNIFRDDPAALAEWTSASHIERAPRRNKTAKQTPTKLTE